MTMPLPFDPPSLLRVASQWAALFLPIAIKGSLLVALLLLVTRILRALGARPLEF